MSMPLPARSHDRKCFYKYMPAKTAKIVLENNVLRWSWPAFFNDPFDLQIDLHMEYNRDRLVNRVLQPIADIYLARAQAIAGNRFDENIKLLRALMLRLTEAELRNEHRQLIYDSLKAAERNLPKTHDELREGLAELKILCLPLENRDLLQIVLDLHGYFSMMKPEFWLTNLVN
jgi:hypothetical protein